MQWDRKLALAYLTQVLEKSPDFIPDKELRDRVVLHKAMQEVK